MRLALAALLVVAAAGCLLAACWALRNLRAAYKDSPDATYVLVGAVWITLAAALLAVAFRLLRRR
jgi:hypothetical protein